jgi:DNA-binding CsgD family transcriptional regulator
MRLTAPLATARVGGRAGDDRHLVGALNVGEVVWSQTESIRYFYGHRERSVFLARLANIRGRNDLAEEVAASLGTRRPRSARRSHRTAQRGCRDLREIGAYGDATRVDDVRRELGVHPKKSRPKRPAFGWESLTPMEIAVSELVTEGLTNPEIGVRLYVSRRTVDTHLAHVVRRIHQPGPTRCRTHSTNDPQLRFSAAHAVLFSYAVGWGRTPPSRHRRSRSQPKRGRVCPARSSGRRRAVLPR